MLSVTPSETQFGVSSDTQSPHRRSQRSDVKSHSELKIETFINSTNPSLSDNKNSEEKNQQEPEMFITNNVFSDTDLSERAEKESLSSFQRYMSVSSSESSRSHSNDVIDEFMSVSQDLSSLQERFLINQTNTTHV